jgi:hypothetical protein
VGLTDKFKDLKDKAEDAAAQHNEQIRGAIQKAASTADEKTGGKYSEKIEQMGTKADAFVGGLGDPSKAAAPDAEQAPAESEQAPAESDQAPTESEQAPAE